MKFKYERFPPDDDPTYFPTLTIRIINPKTNQESRDYKVILDSGAASCVFHSFIGEDIGIKVKSGVGKPLKGITEGAGRVYFHEVIVSVGGNKYNLEVGFSDDLRYPMGLIGERGFFEQNRICFDLPKGEFEINHKIP